jgi:hypothetical protein
MGAQKPPGNPRGSIASLYRNPAHSKASAYPDYQNYCEYPNWVFFIKWKYSKYKDKNTAPKESGNHKNKMCKAVWKSIQEDTERC